MAEILPLGIFHFSGKEDIFTDSMQNGLEALVDRLASLRPIKLPWNCRKGCKGRDLDGFYSALRCDALKQKIRFDTVHVYGQEVD